MRLKNPKVLQRCLPTKGSFHSFSLTMQGIIKSHLEKNKDVRIQISSADLPHGNWASLAVKLWSTITSSLSHHEWSLRQSRLSWTRCAVYGGQWDHDFSLRTNANRLPCTQMWSNSVSTSEETYRCIFTAKTTQIAGYFICQPPQQKQNIDVWGERHPSRVQTGWSERRTLKDDGQIRRSRSEVSICRWQFSEIRQSLRGDKSACPTLFAGRYRSPRSRREDKGVPAWPTPWRTLAT